MKFIPKYCRTLDESFDSDDLLHILNNLKKEEDKQFWKWAIPTAIGIALLIVFIMQKIGG